MWKTGWDVEFLNYAANYTKKVNERSLLLSIYIVFNVQYFIYKYPVEDFFMIKLKCLTLK